MALFLIFSGTFCRPCRELEASGFYDQIHSLCNEYDNVTFKMIQFDQWKAYVPINHPRYDFYNKIVICTPIFIIVNQQLHDDPNVDDLTLLKSTSIFNMNIEDGVVGLIKQKFKRIEGGVVELNNNNKELEYTIENIKDFIENSIVFDEILNIKEPAI